MCDELDNNDDADWRTAEDAERRRRDDERALFDSLLKSDPAYEQWSNQLYQEYLDEIQSQG